MANENLRQVSINNVGMVVPTYVGEGRVSIDDYVVSVDTEDIEEAIEELEAYLGLMDEDVLGLQVDLENKTFKRIGGARNLTAGADFDKFPMYGGRRRCNVADDGTITAYYGDAGYTEDGSNGQVMVYQPKFYYRVMPVKLETQDDGKGYHLRKANYYVTEHKRPGFKIHPAFVNKNGVEVEYILHGAFEGCLYDASASAYITDDAQIMDANNDKFASVGGVKPASGMTQQLTRLNMEKMCQNRGSNWHLQNIQIASAEQLLMMIELGTMNFQSAIGNGVVSFADGTTNLASITGSTVGNGTGQASSTTDYEGNIQTENGKVSVAYRGLENFWGNIWQNVIGTIIYGDGTLKGGETYIALDYSYSDTMAANYKAVGFTLANANGYINAFGYSRDYDWLFMTSEVGGNSAVPVGDYYYCTQDLSGMRCSLLGGRWHDGLHAGSFYWHVYAAVARRHRSVGGRLVYIPEK